MTKTYETWSNGIHRVYGITVGDIQSDFGDRPVTNIVLISEEPIAAQEAP
jgi:hypothetical protein